AADFTAVEADAAVPARAQDEPAVGAEGDARQQRRVAAEVEEGSLGAGPPEPGTDRPGGDDPAAVRAERSARDGAEVADEDVQELAGADVPRLHVALEARRQEGAAVRA